MIDKLSEGISDLTKDGIARRRLEIDVAKLKFERKRLTVAVVGAIVAAGGLTLGTIGFLQSQADSLQQKELAQQALAAQNKRILDQNKSDLERELALRFSQLKDKDRGPFLQSISIFGDLDPKFIKRLTDAIEQAEAVELANETAQNEIEKVELGNLANQIENLTGAQRHSARDGLAIELQKCAKPACAEFVNSLFEVENLITSQRYRRALGIANALGKIDGTIQDPTSRFAQLFADESIRGSVLEKLQTLSRYSEPALRRNAEIALEKF